MMKTWLVSTSVLSMALSASAVSAQALAPEAAPVSAAPDDGGLKEIVVTAQKREQNLQKVGISITAITGDQIRESNISSSIDLITRTPSVDNYSPYGPGSSANIVIRGVGLNDFGEGNEAPVTVYVDEFYIVNVPAVDFALFDMARAEILRGPQGTLFGRNSTGGLVNYVTEKPSDKVGGYFKVGYSRFNELKAEGAFNTPITDVLSGRISFISDHSDGYIKNINPALEGDKAGQAGTDAVRAQLRYNDGNWDVLLKAEYGTVKKRHTYYEQEPSAIDPTTGAAYLNPTGADATGYNQLDTAAAAKGVADTNYPQYLKASGETVLLRADHNFGDTSFTSLSGYQHFKRYLQEDCDAGPNNACTARFPFQSDSASQEFRFYHKGDKLRWTAGAYGLYSHSKNNPDAVFNIAVSGPQAVDPSTGLYDGNYLPISLAANWTLRTYSLAGFAQAEYDFTPEVTLIAGGRITYDNKSFDDADNASLRSCPGFALATNCFLAPQGTGTANPFIGKYDAVLFSGKVELDYKPSNAVLLYASVSRGTKSGGFSNGFYPSGVQTTQLKYGAETNYSFELGEKITLFDHKLRINTSAFYYDYLHFQTFNFEGVGGLLSNHNAQSYGLETEIEVAPVRNLTISGGGSYLHTNIDAVAEGLPSGGSYVADRQMSNAPHWTGNVAAAYRIPLSGDRAMTLSWDGNYRSSRYTNNFNDPSVHLAGYFMHNASVSFDLSKQVEVQGFIRNISNRRVVTRADQMTSLSLTQFIYSEPRIYGASATFRF